MGSWEPGFMTGGDRWFNCGQLSRLAWVAQYHRLLTVVCCPSIKCCPAIDDSLTCVVYYCVLPTIMCCLSIKGCHPTINDNLTWVAYYQSRVAKVVQSCKPSCEDFSLSGSLWLSLASSGSLMLPLALICSLNLLKKSLLGSQGPCSARSSTTALLDFLQVCLLSCFAPVINVSWC